MSTARIHNLEPLLSNPGIWRAGAHRTETGLRTGFPALDAALPGGGWSAGAVSEVLLSAPGIGELRLVLTALAAQSDEQRCVIFLDPPAEPCVAALAQQGLASCRIVVVRSTSVRDRQWAGEQLLRSSSTAAVLMWDSRPSDRSVRRLQVAAAEGKGMCFLFAPVSYGQQTSPAALRMHVAPTQLPNQVSIDILKCKGPRVSAFVVDLSDALARDPIAKPRG